MQIEPFIQGEVLEAFDAENIVVGKPPASTTATTQPCDVGNIFRGSKAHLAKLDDSHTPLNSVTARYVKAAIKTHEAEMGHKLKATHETKVLRGVLRAIRSLRDVVKQHTVEESFRECGVFPYNFSKIIKKCKTDTDFATQEHYKTIVPTLEAILEDKGQLKESDFDMVGVGHSVPPKGKNKEELVLSRKRAVILTNENVIAREILRRREIEDKKNTAADKRAARAARKATKISA